VREAEKRTFLRRMRPFVGWISGSPLMGALFGLAVGLFAAFRSANVMDAPNVNKPG
jgi:hypothetical protein